MIHGTKREAKKKILRMKTSDSGCRVRTVFIDEGGSASQRRRSKTRALAAASRAERRQCTPIIKMSLSSTALVLM